MRGLCYLGQNDLERALASFDGAIATNPMSPDAYQHRSDLYVRKGDWAKSKHDAEQAIQLKSRLASASTLPAEPSYPVLFDQQNLAYLARDYDRAIDLSNQILSQKLTPAQASMATMRRGNSYFAKNDVERALQDQSEAIRLNPRNATAYLNRAVVLEKQGNEEEALGDYSRAISIDPKYALAYLDRDPLPN